MLARAKDRARQLIDKLPSGSKISIIPACGSRDGYSPDPYDTKENSLEALDKIALVDRSASIVQVVNEAKKASEAAPELAKRIVFISDQQESNWRDAANAERLKELPAMQVVDVAPPEWENTWVSDVRLQDGIADVETPATVVVQLMHRGTASRQNVPVTLSLGDSVIGEKTVTLEPGLGLARSISNSRSTRSPTCPSPISRCSCRSKLRSRPIICPPTILASWRYLSSRRCQ